ncbi:MAG: 16S rRNA (guanine(527)-N(7))-methyltransferase RsmG [Bacteroidales bacterium]|nr:16S rRNA (guanine(527)-N(7))-methyltransferase RsmG [Bacteroidales bacterium]
MMKPDRKEFERAVSLWTEWNGKINVISRKDVENIYDHHILHSLAIAEYLERQGEGLFEGESVLDLGTGGGFPGIPLAMACPGVRFTLCDSIHKKILVAGAVADGLGLENVKCVCDRAENLPEVFDWVVSRAVTSLDNFYPWVRGKYRKGILYLKGGDVNEEIAALCGKFKIDPHKITAWPVSEWLDDEYYKEKFVIHIRK